MPAVEQKQSQVIFFEEVRVEPIETISCSQIRERLDALFDGESPLEEMPAQIKRGLFTHLERCPNCCRAFDARVRFRPASRALVY